MATKRYPESVCLEDFTGYTVPGHFPVGYCADYRFDSQLVTFGGDWCDTPPMYLNPELVKVYFDFAMSDDDNKDGGIADIIREMLKMWVKAHVINPLYSEFGEGTKTDGKYIYTAFDFRYRLTARYIKLFGDNPPEWAERAILDYAARLTRRYIAGQK